MGFGTLLLDLFTIEEARAAHEGRRVAIDAMTARLVTAIDWLTANDETRGLPIGIFAAGDGAAAALVAAAERPHRIAALVLRGGRTGLAPPEKLAAVRAPTLFVLGSEDVALVAENCATRAALAVERRLDVIPTAGHLFEEDDTFESMVAGAGAWFARHLSHGPGAAAFV